MFNPFKTQCIMKKYTIEMHGKIYGDSNNFEDAKSFARCLGKNAIIFCGGIVAYPI